MGLAKKKEGRSSVARRELTDRERTAIEAFQGHRKSNPAPRWKVGEGTIAPDHPNEGMGELLLMHEIGSMDADFVDGLVNQLHDASSHEKRQITEHKFNFALSVVKGIKPRDQMEVMLAAQMAAIHMATMTFAGRLSRVESIAQQDSAERALNKLARTFTTQMEALKRYRAPVGEQKVTVQHVTVGEGAQAAIVGNMTAAETSKSAESKPSPRALTDSRIAPMSIVSADEDPEHALTPLPYKHKVPR